MNNAPTSDGQVPRHLKAAPVFKVMRPEWEVATPEDLMGFLQKPTRALVNVARWSDQRLHRMFSGISDSTENPLFGDRCIEYAYVIEQLNPLDRYSSVLDVGCSGSTLTTSIKAMGFRSVHGIDLRPSPLDFPGVEFFCGDFLTSKELSPRYDVVVFCSSIEHFGLRGRYGSQSSNDADLRAFSRAIDLLPMGGVLVLTVPYGVERIIAPWHRVYNKSSPLLKYALESLELKADAYFARGTSDHWAKCTEAEAARVVPTANSYALGMFTFIRSDSPPRR